MWRPRASRSSYAFPRGSRAEEQRIRLRYRRRPSAVRAARRHADGLAHGWGVKHLADGLTLAVSELVTNALEHDRTGRGSRIRVTYVVNALRLRVEVHDTAEGVPHSHAGTGRLEGDTAESGRGLLIVEAVTDRWGVFPEVVGKTVWCEIDLPEGNEPALRTLRRTETASPGGW